MSPIHIVSAFATAQGLSLGQIQVAQKSNEITAIPKLLDMLMLKECTVTTDAMGCQRAIAEKIIKNKGDYVLAVKENQKKLLEDIALLFVDPTDQMHHFKTTEHAHGREEVRECFVSTDIDTIRNHTHWKNLKTVACITDTRTFNGTQTVATRYFISSLKKDANEMLRVVRAHWQIETSLHCILDIAFREDESRIRTGCAAQNFALMRKIALNLLRNEKTTKGGIKAKRLQAGWNTEYLFKVLTSWES
jgi:predicted transposase YbfD/YdcC